MNYKEAFGNFGKALDEGFTPDHLGESPRQVDVPSETLHVAGTSRVGTIAGMPSDRLLDQKEHFPVVTDVQSHSSMARVMQLTDTPTWYSGSLSELRYEVYAGIMELHPDIKLNVRISAEQAVALSDGETPAVTSKTAVKDPNDDRKQDMVPQVAAPKLTSAQVEIALQDEEVRNAVASRLMEMIDKQLVHIQTAKKLGARLLKGGLKAEEFEQLNTFTQEDILRELLSQGATAAVPQTDDRRRELLNRMQDNS